MFTLTTIQAIVEKIKAAQTVNDLDALWQSEIGYSVLSENPDCTAAQLRADLFDYAREMCFDGGYHCVDAGIPDQFAFTTGDLVRFVAPFDAVEACERFIVIEDRGDRMLCEFVCDMTIKPRFVYLRNDLIRA